jgi:hypothetical protein
LNKKVELPDNLINKLSNLPEQGMGYQKVDIKLKNGTNLTNRTVLNSTFLILFRDEKIIKEDIEDADLSKDY